MFGLFKKKKKTQAELDREQAIEELTLAYLCAQDDESRDDAYKELVKLGPDNMVKLVDWRKAIEKGERLPPA